MIMIFALRETRATFFFLMCICMQREGGIYSYNIRGRGKINERSEEPRGLAVFFFLRGGNKSGINRLECTGRVPGLWKSLYRDMGYICGGKVC